METLDQPLDALDLRILEILQKDVTTSHEVIAKTLSSSKTVIWRRIQRLLGSGIIRERVAVLDHRKLGYSMMVFAHVKMARHGKDALPDFIKAVKTFPQVLECHTLMGQVDFLLKIVVPSLEAYENFVWRKLSQIEGVQEVHSSISMSQGVNTTRLPLSASLLAEPARKPAP
jgi:Lrp/AsnC family transcriptional regulator